jgi:hypothetical protein
VGLYDELTAILDCIQLELIDAGRTVPVDVFIAPGLPVFDDTCGQLWVRVVRYYSSDEWPIESTPSLIKCNTDMVAEIGVGITRCQSGIASVGSGGHPTAEQQSSDAAGLICDAGALLRGMVCCYIPTPNIEIVAGTWTQLEPQGGVIGGEWSAFIDADLYCEVPVVETSPGSP